MQKADSSVQAKLKNLVTTRKTFSVVRRASLPVRFTEQNLGPVDLESRSDRKSVVAKLP